MKTNNIGDHFFVYHFIYIFIHQSVLAFNCIYLLKGQLKIDKARRVCKTQRTRNHLR